MHYRYYKNTAATTPLVPWTEPTTPPRTAASGAYLRREDGVLLETEVA
jgi:hypothetical protein